MMTAVYIYIQTVMEHDTRKHVFFLCLEHRLHLPLEKSIIFKGYGVYVKDTTENFDNYYPRRKKELDCDLNRVYTG